MNHAWSPLHGLRFTPVGRRTQSSTASALQWLDLYAGEPQALLLPVLRDP